jgi:hypothetical protein
MRYNMAETGKAVPMTAGVQNGTCAVTGKHLTYGDLIGKGMFQR